MVLFYQIIPWQVTNNMYSVREYADLFINREGIHAMPVNVKKIAKSKGYIIKSYSKGAALIQTLGLDAHTRTYDSFSCYYEKKCFIFLADGLDRLTEQRLIGHELGHIEMHMSDDSDRVLIGHDDDEDAQWRLEREADEFGALIRSPLALLYAMGISDISDIMKAADVDRKDAIIISQALVSYKATLKVATKQINEYREQRRTYLRSERAKMIAKILGVTAITLTVCFGVFCLTASVFSGLHASDLIGLPESSASHEASSLAASSAAPESSFQLPGGEPEPSPAGSDASSQADHTAQSQTAAQQPAGYAQPKQPSTQASSSQVYTPPASSSAPVVPPVSSAAPPASSAAPPESSSVPDYVIPVKPKEPLIEITPYTRYYWTGGETKYHLFSDCYHIRNSEYQKESGLVADAKAAGKDGLCADCSRRNKEG